MTAKEAARQVVDAMPEDATLEDVIRALYLRVKFDRGEQQIRQGKGIPHHLARERLAKWLK